jgi:hypothetical protein
MAWKRGQSGNPRGRPPTSTVAQLRAQLGEHLPELVQRVLLQAMAGDTTAQRLLLDRVWPALKAEQLPILLPDYSADSPLMQQGKAIFQAMADGQIPPDVANELLAGLARMAGIKAVDELESRIRALEGDGDGFTDLA